MSDPREILKNKLIGLGIDEYRIKNNMDCFEIGRVVLEYKERYIVKTNNGEFDAEITGNLRFMANNREDSPAVGDWVALTTYDTWYSWE